MKRFWILCFCILSSVALFNRVTEVTALPFQEEAPGIALAAEALDQSAHEMVATAYNLEELVKDTSYQLPSTQVLSGNERSSSVHQRRNVQLTREVKDYPLCNTNDSFITYHKLSGGDYLNVSAPKQFFIYTLHRIRI